jgi:hypothetical protein
MTLTPTVAPSTILWEQFLAWARVENGHQKKIAGVHGADHANPDLRGRTYFEVNLYRYFHALQVCWPYLNRPGQKVMDVGSWPGAWLRVIAHFAAAHEPQVWASGLMFPDDFLGKMGGACQGTIKCELDVWSPMCVRDAPTQFSEREFTLVTAMEVVEHLYHPGGMFKVIHDSMSPGGILFLTTNNIARLSNVYGLLRGLGVAGNLNELLPRDGGILGAWRPHAREYAWRELDAIARNAGFESVDHGFYQENYALRLLEQEQSPTDDLLCSGSEERRFAQAIAPMLREPGQLKSGMYLVLKKV